jgi:prolyl-tRNA editing enzyme YbaK/EbsC (Cys-tRNA(Pro) deacylase)
MNDALTLHRILLENDVRHEIVQLPRTITSADQLADVLALPARRCLAVRVFQVDDGPAAFIVRAGQVPSAEAIRDVTGARVARAADEHTISLVTGYAAGLVAPLALPTAVTLYVDQAVADEADTELVVYTATGESGTALGIGLRDLLTLCAAKPTALPGRQ